MRRMSFQLAQINVAQARGPLDSPVMAEFTAQLDAVNALADAAPGFVWRYQASEGDETASTAFPDPLTLVNMSVWADLESLKAYVYRQPQHAAAFRRRRDWFTDTEGPHMAFWWIPTGERPTVAEGRRRLDLLAQEGPSEAAFTFKSAFPPPAAS